MALEGENDLAYSVVKNVEDQYSIWEADRPLPKGWVLTGFTGSEKACLEYIDGVWTDMRPRSMRSAREQKRD